MQAETMRAHEPQSARAVLMIRPAAFGFNSQTHASNQFSRHAGMAAGELAARARAEFDAWVAALQAAGIEVSVLEDAPDSNLPDAVFSNNWISLHADGTAVLYPMAAPVRRAERRPGDVAALLTAAGYRIERWLDLTSHENSGRFLEGTGSLVLDRPGRLALASASSRTDRTVAEIFARELGYRLEFFTATDPQGRPVYHTNVILCLGTHFALLCREAVAPEDRARIERVIEASGRELIDLSWSQILSFAGNALELRTACGEAIVAMSSQAYASLTKQQRARLAGGNIVHAPLTIIETYGGGSARCTLTENHLPS
jgi:hypothetical protein